MTKIAISSVETVAKLLVGRMRYFLSHPRHTPDSKLENDMLGVLRKLRADGYAVLPSFYANDHCNKLCKEIDRILEQQPDVVQADRIGADMRVFGSEKASKAIAAYNSASAPISIGEAYRGSPLVAFTTLAGRIEAKPGNIGSGQGWHRDAFHFQYKSMVYLTNVDIENGPFQILQASHRLTKVVSDTVTGHLPPPPDSRLSQDQIDLLIAKNPDRLRTLCAPAGTLILFDSSAIHRGSPIEKGVRYALTNYYFEPEQVPAIEKKFAPYAKPLIIT